MANERPTGSDVRPGLPAVEEKQREQYAVEQCELDDRHVKLRRDRDPAAVYDPARALDDDRTARNGQARIDGPRRLYSLDPAPLEQLDEWLAPYRDFWATKLDALGDHLDRTD